VNSDTMQNISVYLFDSYTAAAHKNIRIKYKPQKSCNILKIIIFTFQALQRIWNAMKG